MRGLLARRAKQIAKFLRLLPRARYRHGLRHGVGAAIEHRSALAHLAPATAVDIGANRGQFSLFLTEAFPNARVYAFEPLAEAAARFQALFASGSHVTLYQVAIGPIESTATIHVSRRDDSSSLLPITSLQEALFPGTGLKETQTIAVAPLDNFLTRDSVRPPALLKLDVQGYELEALKGCDTLLDRFAHVYAECSFLELYAGQALADEVVDYLHRRGFRLRGVFNMNYARDGRTMQGDFLFEAAERQDDARGV